MQPVFHPAQPRVDPLRIFPWHTWRARDMAYEYFVLFGLAYSILQILPICSCSDGRSRHILPILSGHTRHTRNNDQAADSRPGYEQKCVSDRERECLLTHLQAENLRCPFACD